MSEHVSKFVDDLSKGHNAEAGEAFKDALRAKVADGLDQARVNIAGKIFSDVEAQPFSDPKPAVTDPSPETATMMDTQGHEIAFEPNGNEQPTATDEVPANDETQSTT
jgi:hypothetical protein|tara:strand:+ start:479 stop:802 length:324 start_codon:yes stop_codon:yes gene_type:complete